MNMKKIVSLGLSVVLTMSLLTGCGGNSENNGDTAGDTQSGFTGAISVISREDGSGTRGAFVELFGVEEKDAEGNKIDYTTLEAIITNSTSVMMTSVAGDEKAIGYISLGSLNDSVKAIQIDGVDATADNIKNGSYAISRPFNIATYGDVSELTQDFINFILSEEGQAVVEEEGYISEGNNGAYEKSNGLSGKITVGGSSSVTPVMGKLKEAYEELNPDVSVDVQQTDSSTGMEDTLAGVCQIGMASRALKDSEMEDGLIGQTIALDGIAVIVNKESDISDITSEQVKNIYTGEITSWDDITE